jgi:hypothetical protein
MNDKKEFVSLQDDQFEAMYSKHFQGKDCKLNAADRQLASEWWMQGCRDANASIKKSNEK